MEDFNPDDEPKEPKREEEEESDLVGHEKFHFINAWSLDSYPLFFFPIFHYFFFPSGLSSNFYTSH